jgi:hypothetical protein
MVPSPDYFNRQGRLGAQQRHQKDRIGDSSTGNIANPR